MKAITFFVAFLLAVVTAEEFCYKEVDAECSGQVHKQPDADSSKLKQCNASYGHDIDIIMKHLVDYANSHIVRSFDYLLMSTHYGNYQKNRAGFEKLFRGLSDSKWDEAIDIIKHVTKRGGTMKFEHPKSLKASTTHEFQEIQSVAKALDMEKELALKGFDVHREASQRSNNKHDPEISSYIEKEFVHGHAHTIRKLAGYVSDLNSMLRESDRALSLFLFDEYLQKE